jgi:hypothetical protein
MNDLERNSLRNAVAGVTSLVRRDMDRMGMLPKQFRKKLHKERMQAFQNNAFNKKK